MMPVNIKSAKEAKKMGRPIGRSGHPLQIYVDDDFLAVIDEWRSQQRPIPNRSVAIRRLVEMGAKQ